MKHRSSSRDNKRVKRKKSKTSSYVKYDDSSDERGSPDKVRRRRSPSSPPMRYERMSSPKENVEKTFPPYKVLCVSALHRAASDEAVREILYKEYKKFGEMSVRFTHDMEERLAYVCFRNHEDAHEARHSKPRIVIYDKVALVEPVYENALDRSRRQRSRSFSPDFDRYARRSPVSDLYRTATDRFYDRLPYAPLPMIPRDFRRDLAPMPHAEFMPRPPLHPALAPPLHLPPHLYGPPRPFLPFKPHFHPFMDKWEKKERFPNYLHHVPPEEDPLATRTLFAGNLELSITEDELRRIFNRYGVVEDVDIKRPIPGTGNAYAFVRYKNLDMAHRAKVELSGQYIGKFQCKIGYGKASPTTRIWVGGLGPWTSTAQLEHEFDRFGAIKKIDYDKADNCAYILYDSIDAATAAVKEMRGFPLGGSEHKVRVDFADVGSRHTQTHSEPPSHSYTPTNPYMDDIAASAGDYRARSGSGRDGMMYDPYDSWQSGSYDYDSKNHGSGHYPDRKYDKDEYPRRSPSSTYRKEGDLDGDQNNKKRKLAVVYARSNNSGSDSDTSSRSNDISSIRSLADLGRKGTVLWQGALLLKNSLFPAKFYLTDGSKDIVNSLMLNGKNTQLLRITQRLRLDQAKLNDVTKRMMSSNSHAVFVALAGSLSAVSSEDASMQIRPLKNLILYLKQKEAAGVISLVNKDTALAGVLYAFPPCAYAADLVKRTAHKLTDDILKEDHLVIVVVTGVNPDSH